MTRGGAISKDAAIYEYRVWGPHRDARKRLDKLADHVSSESIEDCYLVTDDMTFNAKIRDNTLKIKQLVAERKGFEQWVSDRHERAKTAPSPFDDLFERLRLDRPQRGKRYDLRTALARLDGDDVRAVFVAKERRIYRIGELRAESAVLRVEGSDEPLHTLSIEGTDLGALRKLRAELDLTGQDNIAIHEVIGHELGVLDGG